MKRILFVAEELDTNGAMFSLLALLKTLPTDKYSISLFLFRHDGCMMEQLPEHVTLLPESLPYVIHRLPLRKAIMTSLKSFRFDLTIYRILLAIQRRLKWDFKLWFFLPKVKGNFDVVCCYTDGFVAPMVLRKVNATRKCSWVHASYSHWQQIPCVYKALKKMDICVPVSIDTGKDLDKTLSVHVPQHIVHNITDAEQCQIRANKPCESPRKKGVFRIVSVGRVTYQKHFDIIPSVAMLLNEKRLKYEWYIIGNGDKYDELVELTKSLGLEKNVHFIGASNNPMPWIESADVFVNPSRSEAWGMTVSEALCLGKAVIVSDIPVFSEQIKDGENGLIRKVTPKTMADAILMIAENANLRHKLEQNAKKYPYTKETIIHEFNQLIERLGV